MEILLSLDSRNYTDDMPVYERFAVRAIIERSGLLAMQLGNAGDYKLPGGMLDQGETPEQALVREVREETGLLVIPESIRPWGEVVERRRDLHNAAQQYICHSLCYYCKVSEQTVPAQPTPSEVKRGYHLVWATLDNILAANRAQAAPEVWSVRDTKILAMLDELKNK